MAQPMNEEPLLSEATQYGGLVTIEDSSRHYFGGYWRVQLTLTCHIPLSLTACLSESDRRILEQRLGDDPCFERTIEQMAVPELERGQVRQRLFERLNSSVLPLVHSDRFPVAFFKAELNQASKRMPRGFACHR